MSIERIARNFGFALAALGVVLVGGYTIEVLPLASVLAP
jgi:hypothetical protein